MGIIVKSKIRDLLGGLNLGEDLGEELEKRVREILKNAEIRARKNFRRTVYARDL